MENNVIYKLFLQQSALNESRKNYDYPVESLFKNMSPFYLFNIIGKNRLFFFAIVLIVIYSWFIRANINLGAIFGLFFLGFIFYIYYTYQFYGIKEYAIDKQQKINFLADILSKDNLDPIEGTEFFNKNFFLIDYGRLRNFLYFNPAVVDFYYNNKDFINHSYLNYARSLRCINMMIILTSDITAGLANRGNQYTMLEMLRERCLNYWQAIIYGVPSTNATNNKFQESLNVLEQLTQNLIDNAAKKIDQQNTENGINMAYYPIYKGGPKPNDVNSYGFNSHFNFFN